MIRRMTCEDLEEVALLEQKSFSDPWSINVYRQTLEIDGVIYLVSVEDNKIVSVCGVRNIVGVGEITNVMTDEAYRGRGLAYLTLQELIRCGKDIGVIDFTLEVRAGNTAAIRLYEKLGFESEGIRLGYYEHPKEDALIMWKRNN